MNNASVKKYHFFLNESLVTEDNNMFVNSQVISRLKFCYFSKAFLFKKNFFVPPCHFMSLSKKLKRMSVVIHRRTRICGGLCGGKWQNVDGVVQE